jgi:hypothetical protein
MLLSVALWLVLAQFMWKQKPQFVQVRPLVTHLRQAPQLLERLLVPDIFLAVNINNIFLICLMLLIKL